MKLGKMIVIALAGLSFLAATPVKARPIARPKQVKRQSKALKKAKTSPTISDHSYIVLNQATTLLNNNLQKTKKKAKKGQGYRIYRFENNKNQIYYALKNNLWLPAKSTHGTVWYRENNSIVVLTTNKKGQLSYSFYDAASQIKNLVVTHNAYVYTSRGLIQRNKYGTITLLKKGRKLRGYYISKLNGQNFYITDHGWVKTKNVTADKGQSKVKTKKITKNSSKK